MESLVTGWQAFGEKEAFSGYLARPARAPDALPGVLIVHEALGVSEHIQDVTRRFARAGYAAFAPDLFSRDGTRPPQMEASRLTTVIDLIQGMPPADRMNPAAREAAIDRFPADEAARIRETIGALFAGGHFPPLLAAARFLHEELPLTRGQKIGAVGFCMGGGLSMLLACKDPSLRAAVSFYGRPPPPEEIPNVGCPILALYGSEDVGLMESLPALQAAMKAAGKSFEAVVYDGAEHAFFNDSRPLYSVAASRAAFARTLGFLAEALG
ncbi:MAG TPA: dienelactone hydrolase family protein [Polyangiaceae bacterium]|nr:dienelactone hydrolase family protein [Polyangiaceae bacterium]